MSGVLAHLPPHHKGDTPNICTVPPLAHRQAASVVFWAPATTTRGDQKLHCNQGHHTAPTQKGPARQTALPSGPADGRTSHQASSYQAALHADILYSIEKQRLNQVALVLPENAFRGVIGNTRSRFSKSLSDTTVHQPTAKMRIPSQVYVPGGLCGERVCVLRKHHGTPPGPERRGGRTVARQADICLIAHG